MPPKRACDICISRKIKCSGSWPCDSCRNAVQRVSCTYLKPTRKRGPKVRRSKQQGGQAESSERVAQNDSHQLHEILPPGDGGASCRISKAVLAPIVRLYQQYSYSVWPIINADALLERLVDIDPEKTSRAEENLVCLATALCAATAAQLHLAPVADGRKMVDSAMMARACFKARGCYGIHWENPDITSVLVSFFLHVYHAKVNQRTSATMYIHEAISGARVLRLDEPSSANASKPEGNRDFIANRQMIFPLLWVSERGYALHLGLSPSYMSPPYFPALEDGVDVDIYVQGLLDLVKLFIAFDDMSVHRGSHGVRSTANLIDTEMKVSSLYLTLASYISTRTADCHITRQWMRTILWQEALSSSSLSSSSNAAIMTFSFPAQVGRDLLQSLQYYSETDLLPLGRDQLLKCFEIANSLADICLLASARFQPSFEFCPQDFLHALYQKLLPFLEQDPMLNSILRYKTAEVLVMTPARLMGVDLRDSSSGWAFHGEDEQNLAEV